MATLKEFRDERIRKLNELRDLGVEPYPVKTNRTHKINEIVDDFDKQKGKEVSIVGRITGIRKFGKIAFIVLRDFTGEIQLFLTEDTLSKLDAKKGYLGLKELSLLDTGDFLEAEGKPELTKTGEKSIFAEHIRLLSKSLRPMPVSHQEFKDKEERFRRRYVDMNVNKEVRDRMERRSKFWQATRQFYLDHDYVEINIPVLEHTTGGADANPFITHMDALDQDFYLRISHELPLKRLIGGGFEKVFDIGARFRNEGVDDEHLPEHIAMEDYAAYQDYTDGMKFHEEMIKYVAEKTWGTLKFDVGGFKIDLSGEWPRVKYADIIKEKYGIDVFDPDVPKMKQILKDAKVVLDGEVNTSRLLDNVWKLIRINSAGPYWLIHEPVEISPLAKKDPEDPRVTQRFHPIIAGTEMGNGFSELNDPLDQLGRFAEQQAMRDAGDDEAQMLDIDYVEMLEYGMPPACGWGNSERNFWLLEGVSGREGVPFPHMKQEISEVTKAIYPEIKL